MALILINHYTNRWDKAWTLEVIRTVMLITLMTSA